MPSSFLAASLYCDRLAPAFFLWPGPLWMISRSSHSHYHRGKSQSGKGKPADLTKFVAGCASLQRAADVGVDRALLACPDRHCEPDELGRTLDDHLDELAHRYGRSSNAGKAVEYLDRAGKQAVTRGSLKEAGIHFKDAIAALGTTSGASQRIQREFDLQLALVEVLLSLSGPVTDEDWTETRRLQELAEETGNTGHLMSELIAERTPWAEFSALKVAYTPKEEFRFREEVVLNSPPARIPLPLSSEFYLGKFESFFSRPEARRDIAAFSAVTVLLLVSLIILYQGPHG